MTGERRDHYSYTVYADPATARTFDERRFGGPIGDLIANDQARVLDTFLAPAAGQSILDVGTGTGRAALLLARSGAHVTGVDASEEMLQIARQRAAQEHAAQYHSGHSIRMQHRVREHQRAAPGTTE